MNFFVQLFKVSNFKNDARRLDQIIRSYVRASEKDTQERVTPYYKPHKPIASFSTRLRLDESDKNKVTYKLSCSEA